MQRRTGFTLTELLIVIAIIGMLAGLLIPAVQMAREAGRRATCTNNQRNVATALLLKESTGKAFPGYMSKTWSGTAGTLYGSWVVQISPELENASILAAWRKGDMTVPPRIPVLICPSSPVDESAGTCNYIVNCGVPDDYANNLSQMLHSPWSSAKARDLGIFAADGGSCSLGDIKDGKSQTLLTSENSYAGKWFGMGVEVLPTAPTARPGANWESALGFCWTKSGTIPQGGDMFPINQTTQSATKWTEDERLDWAGPLVTVSNTHYELGVPASHHSGIVIGTLCDGSTRQFSQDIEPMVWIQLMTPNGHQNGEPAITGEY